MLKSFKAAAAAAITCSVLILAPTAEAATGWQEVAWRDMQRLAPAGSRALGPTFTLREIQTKCRLLSTGVSANTIIDGAFLVAKQSATSQQQKREMIAYDVSLALVAARRLCPAYLSDVWSAIDR